MSDDRIISSREFDLSFSFVSFGVEIRVESTDPTLLEKARGLVERAFGGRAQIFEESEKAPRATFRIARDENDFRLYKDGGEVGAVGSDRILFKYLNSALRLEVAEFARDHVFVHAGVVGWKGTAIILPARSFSGKSTLTAELVRKGAEYYSDEYAVLQPDGCVVPFPRHLSIRYFGGKREKELPPAELGARIGTVPIPVGMVLLTRYEKGAEWAPENLSPGNAIMEMIPNTLSMHRNPAFSLKVLDLVAQRAIIVKSPRGDVKKFAEFLLAFFDKHTKLDKMT